MLPHGVLCVRHVAHMCVYVFKCVIKGLSIDYGFSLTHYYRVAYIQKFNLDFFHVRLFVISFMHR